MLEKNNIFVKRYKKAGPKDPVLFGARENNERYLYLSKPVKCLGVQMSS